MRSDKKICIVDYGVGNLYSVVKAFRKFSENVSVSEEKADIESANALVLPSVGTFEAGMRGLEDRDLVKTIQTASKAGKPILGICLGAQLLLEKGFEFGERQGLGIIRGTVEPFPTLDVGTKIPHMDWDSIMIPKGRENNYWKESIFEGITSGTEVYFVHSYILKPTNDDDVLALTSYGGCEFTSVIRKGKIFGTQFHPEKSGEIGLSIIKNFINMI